MTHCRACNTPLINRRSHAISCSSSCRGKAWRASKPPTTSVKLTLSVPHFELIENAAQSAGMSTIKYMLNRIIQSECSL